MKKYSKYIIVLALLISMPKVYAKTSKDIWDQWEQAHGLNVIRTSSGYNVIWSQAVKKSSNGDWTHDIYGMINNVKKKLISEDEAQEPVNCARSNDGHILLTFEDGNKVGDYGVMQRYAIYDDHLQPVVKYDANKTIIKKGGHSGHVTSVNNNFFIASDEGWVNHDGILNRGTGKDVYLTSMNSMGKNKKTIKIPNASSRYDWPILSGGNNQVMIVFQKIVPHKKYTRLMMVNYNLKSRKLSKIKMISKLKTQYYNYHLSYVKKVKRFVLTATSDTNEGHFYLFDTKGKQLCHKKSLSRFNLESTPAIYSNKLVYPTSTNKLTMFKVTSHSVKKIKTKKISLKWSARGQVGIFESKNKVRFYCLTNNGLKSKTIRF